MKDLSMRPIITIFTVALAFGAFSEVHAFWGSGDSHNPGGIGPWSYWERQAFIVNRDQEISITGSRAQGKDGSMYLFAKRLENKTSGKTLSLRSESGSPLWYRSSTVNGNGLNSGRPAGAGNGFRGGMGGGGRR
jgi:hypothetical protein